MADKQKSGLPSPNKHDRALFARSSRLLMRRARAATLSTALKSGDGWPY